MTVLRLHNDFRMLAVAALNYLARHPAPSIPKDLHTHSCVRCRFPWDGSIQPWMFVNGRQHAEIAVEGSFTVNDLDLLLSATLDGVGISYLAEPLAPYLAQGRLVALLEGWSFTLSWWFPIPSQPSPDAYAAYGISQIHQEMARSRSHGQCFDSRSCYLNTRYCGVSDPGLVFRRRQLMAVANRFAGDRPW